MPWISIQNENQGTFQDVNASSLKQHRVFMVSLVYPLQLHLYVGFIDLPLTNNLIYSCKVISLYLPRA